jgi:hypothetical protein
MEQKTIEKKTVPKKSGVTLPEPASGVTAKKSALRKLSDKEKTEIKKHIDKQGLDTSAARKLRFNQMRAPEGQSVKSTLKKIAKKTTDGLAK